MKSIYTILTTLLIAVTIIFIIQLARLQIFTDNYQLNGFNTSVKKIAQIPQRGYIMDRNGKMIVGSTPTYDINYTQVLLPKNFDTLSFCKTVKISKKDFIKKIKEVQNTRAFNPINSYSFIKNLTKEEVAEIEEKFYKYEGFSIQQKSERKYLTNFAGNVLGYINEANQAEIDKEPNYYEPSDLIGKTGIEKSYEKYLRGTKGLKYIQKDISLNTVGPYKEGKFDQEMQSGQDLMLTLDIDLQEYAEILLSNKRGAVVALDPNTGEILCMASAPSINPNALTGRTKQHNLYAYLNDSIQRPMYDRSVQNAYPPGSTFKTISALVAQQMGVIDSNTAFSCHFGSNFGKRRIKCHDAGMIKIIPSISHSCNSFYSKAYLKMLQKDSTNIEKSINEWNDIMGSFGLGHFFNNDISVGTKGNIPNSDYYNRWYKKGNWNPYTIISNGIGQGEILTSPMQMANFVAAIANKGFFYTPHMVKKIGGKPIDNPNFILPKKTKVDPKYFPIVIEGMRQCFINGTARRMRTKLFSQAGKTGTSQVPHGQVDHSNFIMFAPVDKPKIAIAVVVENGGSGASTAAPIASLIAEKYLMGEVERLPVEKSMIARNLKASYMRNYINQMRKKGWYKAPKPTKEDSIRNVKNARKADSIRKIEKLKKEKDDLEKSKIDIELAKKEKELAKKEKEKIDRENKQKEKAKRDSL